MDMAPKNCVAIVKKREELESNRRNHSPEEHKHNQDPFLRFEAQEGTHATGS